MPETYRSRISTKGQVVIPAEVRSGYGFVEGAEVIITGESGRLILEKVGFDEIYQDEAPTLAREWAPHPGKGRV